jgi:hypothetical protein
LTGGPTVKRNSYKIQLAKKWNDQPNRYQEPKGYQVYGIEFQNISVPTRLRQWTITYIPKISEKQKNQGYGDCSPLELCQ